jgi:hypothetical protein
MLRRDRLIRMQIHQLLDACIFAVSFWLAYACVTRHQFESGLAHRMLVLR